MNEKYADTLMGFFDIEYYSLGVTGAEALATMLDDYNNGRLTELFAENGWGDAEFLGTVNRLAVKWASENVLNVRFGVDA